MTDSQDYVIYTDASPSGGTSCLPYVNSYYRNDNATVTDCNGADVINPGTGTLPDIDFILADGYVISGRVETDTGGEELPIQDVQMDFFTGDPCNGTYSGGRSTDSSGDYCLAVPDGASYFVQSNTSENYANEWYDNTTECSFALPVTVDGGNEPNINFGLYTGATISGTVRDDSLTPLADIEVVAVRNDGTCNSYYQLNSAWSDGNGDYQITGLPAGNYFLWIRNTDGTNYVQEWHNGNVIPSDTSEFNCMNAANISLGPGSQVIEKDFQLELGGQISGTVLQGGATLGTSVQVNVISGDPCNNWNPVTSSFTDPGTGDYLILGIPAGNYWVRTDNLNQVNFMNEWYTGDTDPSDPNCGAAVQVPVHPVVPLTDIDFDLLVGARISGTVYESNGTTPIANIGVQLIETGNPNPCNIYWGMPTQTDETGYYEFIGLAGSTYFVRSENQGMANWVNEWHNGNTYPADVSEMDCSNAAPVVVNSGDHATGKDFALELGGAISGTLYQSDGTTPINDASIGVMAIPDDQNPCGQWYNMGYAQSNPFDGSYSLMGLPAGSYYMLTDNQGSQYVNEWYNFGSGDASEPSDFDCSLAQTVTVTAGVDTSDTDFALDVSGSISGIVYAEDGSTPLGGAEVGVFSRPCDEDSQVGGVPTNGDGTYSISGLPTGNLYVAVKTDTSHQNFVEEWYDGSTGAVFCEQAGTTTVSEGANTPNIDFTLAEGPQRMDWFDVKENQTDDNMEVSFAIEGRFAEQLKQATVTMPNPARGSGGVYTFDLDTDKFSWDSECRYIIFFEKAFGTVIPADYGDYTLTLEFDVDGDGNADSDADEVYTKTIAAPDAISPVTGINVTVNNDGSVSMSWTNPAQTGKYYRARVRSSDGTVEYAATSYQGELDVESMTIPASKLKCLTIDPAAPVSYQWRVHIYDAPGDLATTTASSFVTQAYNPPGADVEKIGQYDFWVSEANGDLELWFTTIPGALAPDYAIGNGNLILSAEVTGPSLYYYNFLGGFGNEGYNISTPTRTNKGYSYVDTDDSLEVGTYTLTVVYDYNGNGSVDGGETETYDQTVTSLPPAPTPVDVASMKQVIHQDGTIDFSWDTPPATDQGYDVRVRSLSGDKEYMRLNVQWNGTQAFANHDNVSAMQVGQTYQWFIRSKSPGGTRTVNSSSIEFIYAPFVEPDATGATFDAGSADIQNPYIYYDFGDRANYAGYGTYDGFSRYILQEGTEEIGGVACLRVIDRGAGNHPDPDQDPEWMRLWLAEDTDGNVWALQIYDGYNSVNLLAGTVEDARLIMPANPQVGQIFEQISDHSRQIQKTNVDVPALSTGLGPFSNCIQILSADSYDTDTIFNCPNYGTVRDETNDGGTNGWELLQPEDQKKFTGDFDGNGTTDILWRRTDNGQTYIWLMNGTDVSSHGYTSIQAGLIWEIVAVGDFDGGLNGEDILWRRKDTGETYLWPMNGTSVSGHGFTSMQAGLVWEIAGVGDFDGGVNGKDILWRRTDTGETYIWPMNGASVIGNGFTSIQVGLIWKVAGIGDFDGGINGEDILWRRTDTGDTYIWPMNGTSVIGDGYTSIQADLNWEIVEIGDSDGGINGEDILWRRTDTGETYLWPMNGNNVSGNGFTSMQAGLVWEIAGVGDFDGGVNGKDILWRRTDTGETYIWPMNGTSVIGNGFTSIQVGLIWKIAGIGDFDGGINGEDILWRRTDTGDTYIWPMNGTSTIGNGFTSLKADLVWEIK